MSNAQADALLDNPFTADAFRARVLHRFTRRADVIAATGGDNALNPRFEKDLAERTFRDAAVMIPVIDRGDHATVLLTQRTDHLSTHKGQIAFPGGKMDAGETAIDAAVRETGEEVGIAADDLDVLGVFGDYLSGSGFRIAPVVAMVRSGFSLDLNENEVAAAFEVPLSFLMTAENHQIESLEWKNIERYFYAMPWQDDEAGVERRIWGVTAGIIRMVHERLYG